MSLPPVHTDVLSCAPRPQSVRLVRRRTARLLTARGWHRDAVGDAELTVAELAANAVRHVPGHTFAVYLTCDDVSALIEVTDRAPHRLPRMRSSTGPEDCTGRGLRLVAATAASWGVTSQPRTAEKTVWALLTCDPDGLVDVAALWARSPRRLAAAVPHHGDRPGRRHAVATPHQPRCPTARWQGTGCAVRRLALLRHRRPLAAGCTVRNGRRPAWTHAPYRRLRPTGGRLEP